MGGRGASSGTSHYVNRKTGTVTKRLYGSQYRTLLQSGNIIFVRKSDGAVEPLMETITRGRVYVRVDGNGSLRGVVYFDSNNKRTKQIDLVHQHKGVSPHTHHGYEHNENDSAKWFARPTSAETKMVERVRSIWENRYKR